MKRSPLRRLTGIHRRTRLRPRSRKREALAIERREFVARILSERPRCEFGLSIRCPAPSVDVHERLTRARGGDILDPLNVTALCRSHHDWVHRNPDMATQYGLLIPSWEKRS